MTYDMNDFPVGFASLNPWVKGKTLDLVNANPQETEDKNLLFEEASVEAEKWYESASEEEKDDIRKRYPDDMDVKD